MAANIILHDAEPQAISYYISKNIIYIFYICLGHIMCSWATPFMTVKDCF